MGKLKDDWEKLKKQQAQKNYEKENPVMLVTPENDTLRFKTPNDLMLYKQRSQELNNPKLSDKESSAVRIATQSFYGLPLEGEYPGSAVATIDSMTTGLKKSPKNSLKATSQRAEKAELEKKGKLPEDKILEHNKKINEIDKAMTFTEKDENGKPQTYYNANLDKQAIAALENRKAALKDSIQIEVKNTKFKRFADTWGVEPEQLKTQYNSAKADIARYLSASPVADPKAREQLAEEIVQKYGFTLKTLRAMDDEFAGIGR